LLDEQDQQIDLYNRLIAHSLISAKYAVYYGEGRDSYDEYGRVAHESIFNTNSGQYRCPNAQQGFSGFSTWTRGLAWAILGFAELLEFIRDHPHEIIQVDQIKAEFLKAALATGDFYIDNSSLDGIPYWNTGAPNLHKLGNYQNFTADRLTNMNRLIAQQLQ